MYHPEGNLKTAEFIVVGEAPAHEEIMRGRPLVGPSGQIFDDALRNAGINRSNCYITNVFDRQITKPKQKYKHWTCGAEEVWVPARNSFTDKGQRHVERLRAELADAPDDAVVIGLGGCALRALTNQGSISLWRGSYMRTTGLAKPLPAVCTFHPASIIHGEDINRWYILNDFRRAMKQKLAGTEPIRPPTDFISNPTFATCLDTIEMLRKRRSLFVADIEVAQRQVSMISFAWSQQHAISIPYGVGNWTPEQEHELWQKTAELFSTPCPKCFHNAAFDVQFLLQIHNIHIAPEIHDTMTLYAVLFPEFRKGLATVATIYTDHSYWKHLVKHSNIAKEDG